MNAETETRYPCPTPLRRYAAFYVLERRRIVASPNPTRTVAAATRLAAYLARSAARDDGADPAGAPLEIATIHSDRFTERLAIRAMLQAHEPRTT